MAKINMKRVGYTGSYEPRLQVVVPQGLVTSNEVDSIVKYYTMFPYGETHDQVDTPRIKNFIRSELKNGEIDRGEGLGFAIVSEGVLNVTMFGGIFKSVVTPNLYEFDMNGFFTYKEFDRNDVKDVGSFCVWEAKDILKFETESYTKNVLYTKGSREGVKRYIEDRLMGVTSDFSYFPEEFKQKVSLGLLGFDKRSVNLFGRKNIFELGDLLKLTEEDLSTMRGIGEDSIEKVLGNLRRLGYELKK